MVRNVTAVQAISELVTRHPACCSPEASVFVHTQILKPVSNYRIVKALLKPKHTVVAGELLQFTKACTDQHRD